MRAAKKLAKASAAKKALRVLGTKAEQAARAKVLSDAKLRFSAAKAAYEKSKVVKEHAAALAALKEAQKSEESRQDAFCERCFELEELDEYGFLDGVY